MKLPEQSRPLLRISAPVKQKVGLGDVVKGITTKLGFKPCGGCERRAAVLNKWVEFGPRNGG